MPMIIARDYENNRWKRKEKKTKIERGKRVEQAIVKMWELNGFAARLS